METLALYTGDLGGSNHLQGTKPETAGFALADSPAGQAAWIYEKFQSKTDNHGLAEDALSRDDMLDAISLYWFTNSAASSGRIYWENKSRTFAGPKLTLPVAVTVFPRDIARLPRSWIRRRALEEGQAAALEPRSRQPRSSPNRITEDIKKQAIGVRAALEQSGLDHGPISVHEKMRDLGMTPVPSTAALARIFQLTQTPRCMRRNIDIRRVTTIASRLTNPKSPRVTTPTPPPQANSSPYRTPRNVASAAIKPELPPR